MWRTKKDSITITYTDKETIITSNIYNKEMHAELLADFITGKIAVNIVEYVASKYDHDDEFIKLIATKIDARRPVNEPVVNEPIVRPSEFLL